MSAPTTTPQPAAPPPSPSGTDPGAAAPTSAAPEEVTTTTSIRRYPGARVVRLLRRRPRHVPSAPRIPTPVLLRVGMVVACMPVGLFGLAVDRGVARNERAVEAVGEVATRGVTLAQQVSLDLAELHEVAVSDLVRPAPLGPGGFPEDYNAQRRDLHETLARAAAEAPSGRAYQQRLASIDYALGHYHALLRDSFSARDQGDAQEAVSLYGQADAVMDGTLLPEADSFHQASTYVLNHTYHRHQADATSTLGLVRGSWVLLLAVLVGLQVLLARKFRRLISPALAAATLVAAVGGAIAISRLDDSSSRLTTAREGAFEAVHALGRARTAAVSAWQAQGQLLLDPTGMLTAPGPDDGGAASRAEGGATAQLDELFRVPDPAQRAAAARAGEVPEGSAGHLATATGVEVSDAADEAARDAVVAFGAFLDADTELRDLVSSGEMIAARAGYESAAAFDLLVGAIDDARSIHRRTFDDHVDAAAAAIEGLGPTNLAAAGLMVALVLLGLYQRLREYRA